MEQYMDDKQLFSRIGFSVALLTLVPQLAVLVLGSLSLLPGPARSLSEKFMRLDPMAQSILLVHLLGGLCYYLCIRKIPKAEPGPKQRWPWYKLAVFGIIGIAIAEIGNLLGNLLMYFINHNFSTSVGNQITHVITQADLGQMFLLIVVIGPAIEEWMLRILLLDRLRPYGDKLCILMSALLFGLIHGNLYQFFYAFALGALLAYIYLKTQRAAYVMGMHMFFNFFGGFIGAWILKRIEKYSIASDGTLLSVQGMGLWYGLLLTAFGLLMIGLSIAGIVLAVLYRKQIRLDKAVHVMMPGQRFQTVCVNPGMIVMAAVHIMLWAIGFL